jgi:CDP-diglyceride synthetase
MTAIHDILFNMQMLYSIGIGLMAAAFYVREQTLTGGFFGAIAVYAILNGVILGVGIVLAATGHTVESDGRIFIYFLYMSFLIVIMPGLFSMLRGRDDRMAAIYFALLAFLNAWISWSMLGRGLTAWVVA